MSSFFFNDDKLNDGKKLNTRDAITSVTLRTADLWSIVLGRYIRYVARILKTPDVPDSHDLDRQIKMQSRVKYSILSTVNLINFSNLCAP